MLYLFPVIGVLDRGSSASSADPSLHLALTAPHLACLREFCPLALFTFHDIYLLSLIPLFDCIVPYIWYKVNRSSPFWKRLVYLISEVGIP